MANVHGLKSPQPIMCCSADSDNCAYMFQCGSKYYLWNPIEGEISEIVTAMNAVGIVTKIAKQGLRSQKLAEVPQVSG
jgi:hypothetical protein